MAETWYEQEEYHRFLVSQERESYLPGSAYSKLFKPTHTDKPFYILDFGAGLGYASIQLAETFANFPNVHIYACDYQEPLLDEFWHTLVKKKLIM